MDPRLKDVASRHGISAEAVTELVALVRTIGGAASTSVPPRSENHTFVDDEGDEGASIEPHPRVAGRYVDLGLIGTGGMGEVRRVHDTVLKRTLAMKLIHPELLDRTISASRFAEEAQATAQLQHPNILPIHDMGVLPDGRRWFTMKEVQGRTLSEVLGEVHAASPSRWQAGSSGWTFRRLVASFLSVCHAMAYAHQRGVVHRDLKPDNVMVGAHGETYVLDWGLAKVVGRERRAPGTNSDSELLHLLSGEDTVVTTRSGSHLTRVGTVAGTPAYMAPEQARGETDRIDARADVYALGAILYELLCGHAPYRGATAGEVLDKVVSAPPPAPTRRGPALPEELVAACSRAMARDVAQRFATANDLADAIEAWLDDARRREQAIAITERALAGVEAAVQLRARASALRAGGDSLLDGLDPWQPERDKHQGWALQDEASELLREADLQELDVDQGLHGALRVAPDLAEAHSALVERYRLRHAEAERVRDEEGVLRAVRLLTPHLDMLPQHHPTRVECDAYLRGHGQLTLVTDPPGARVELLRYELVHRRLVARPCLDLGTTPLVGRSLPMGSYLLVIRHPTCEEVRYPVHIDRQGHWDGVAPGEQEPTPIWLPPRGSLSADEIYVPAGWFRGGGDPWERERPGLRLWCDGVVMQRFPVTNREYLAFLNDLVVMGRTEQALDAAPRERGTMIEAGRLIYGFDGERFALVPDAEGDLWDPEWPVFNVDWRGARAYLDWLAERTGRPWRLPLDREWEKAARGVDGRWYPWGDAHDWSWACNTRSQPTNLPAVVDSFPVDVSPYGARGLAGNVYTWCLDQPSDNPKSARVEVVDPGVDVSPETRLASRGGFWYGSARYACSAYRHEHHPFHRYSNLGLRGVWRPAR